MKIKTKLILIVIVSMVTLTLFFTVNTIKTYNAHLKEHLETLTKDAYDAKKSELLNYSDMANKVILSYYNKIKESNRFNDKKFVQKIQQEALEAIKNMRYGKNGYFWINDMNNKMLMHPIKPEYNGKYFIDTPKVPFVQLGTEKLKQSGKNKVFIEYSFYTPATHQYSHKLSVVQRFVPWDWVVGTGAYTDYLDNRIAKAKESVQKEISNRIQNILITAFVITIVMMLIIVKMLHKWIVKPLDDFQDVLNNFFKYLDGEDIKIKKFKYKGNDEIGLMAQKVNVAIDSAVQTHNELVKLREQLELKVQTTTSDLTKTQKEFELISKNRQESLEYGAVIQKSILPDKSALDKTFSNHFILSKQVDIIHSQFHIFEKLNSKGYFYILLDCKQRGIDGVFTTMLLNAIVKQAITHLKYESNENINAAWVLEYINQHIDSLKYKFDIAVVFYNKEQNYLKFASANLPLHYYQDDAFHIMKPDFVAVGENKDFKYTQHIIEIKEYLEFYISTKQYIQDFIDIYSFVSPFQTKTYYFGDNLQNINDDLIVVGFQIDNKPKVFIEYSGKFTQKLVNQYIETIENQIENIGLMSNISTIFVEQFQNILNYGKSKDIETTEVVSFGYIKLQKNANGLFCIKTTNVITEADKQKIEPKLLEINLLDQHGIRQKYRELRKSGVNTHEKGGGIGFYEIAKRSVKIEYKFTQINKDRFEFEFISFISAGKNGVV